MVQVLYMHDIGTNSLEQPDKSRIRRFMSIAVAKICQVDELKRNDTATSERVFFLEFGVRRQERIFKTSEDRQFMSFGVFPAKALRIDLRASVIPWRVTVDYL